MKAALPHRALVWNLADQVSLKFQGCLKSSRCSELTRRNAQRRQGKAWTHSPSPAFHSAPQQAGDSALKSSQNPKAILPETGQYSNAGFLGPFSSLHTERQGTVAKSEGNLGLSPGVIVAS